MLRGSKSEAAAMAPPLWELMEVEKKEIRKLDADGFNFALCLRFPFEVFENPSTQMRQ